MRAVRLVALALLVLAATGCGGKNKAATDGAKLVPADAPIFISVDSNVESDQWRRIEELVRRFPDGGRALGFLRASFQDETKLDWEQDVKPALGDEIDLVWLDFENGGENVVAIARPQDEAKLRRAVEKGNASDEGGDDLVVGEVGGWLVLSDTQSKIDRFEEESSKGESLADEALFTDAVTELPGERLLTVFARGSEILKALEGLPGLPGGSSLFQLGGARPELLALALTAEDNGLRLVAASRAEQEPKAQAKPYDSKLLDDVPADAIAFLTFRGGESFEKQLSELEGDEAYRELLRELEEELGFRLDRITRLFKNEVALYVRSGTPIPELTLLLEAPDEQEALDAVDDVLQQIARVSPGEGCIALDQAGVTVRCVELDELHISYAGFDGKVVVTTGVDAIEEIRSRGDRLRDSEAFNDARERSGLPDKTNGFVWVDLEQVMPMILGFADLGGQDLPPQLRGNLKPLQSFLGWATTEGRLGSSEVFVEID